MDDTIAQTFSLKGSREYVHGTDIFDGLLAYAGDHFDGMKTLDIVFARMIRNTACVWHYSDDSESIPRDAPCRGQVDHAGGTTYFGLVEQASEGPRARIEYNDEDVSQRARTEPGCATMPVNPNHTWIENLVALTKRFHVEHHKLTDRKWLFGRLTLVELPSECEIMEVTQDVAIAGRMTRNSVSIDGKSAGKIFFTSG